MSPHAQLVIIMSPPLIGAGIERYFCLTSFRLTSVCLSRTSGLSREQRGLGRPKLAQRVAPSHVTRTPLSRSTGDVTVVKVTRPLYLTRKAAVAERSTWERIRRGKVLLHCVSSAARRRLSAHGGDKRGGDILCRHAHSLLLLLYPRQCRSRGLKSNEIKKAGRLKVRVVVTSK